MHIYTFTDSYAKRLVHSERVVTRHQADATRRWAQRTRCAVYSQNMYA